MRYRGFLTLELILFLEEIHTHFCDSRVSEPQVGFYIYTSILWYIIKYNM